MRNRRNIPAIGRIAASTAVAFALFAPAVAHAAPAEEPLKIVVDPGHGGKDPGAVAGGLLEKDGALKISKMVEQSARRQGWEVKLTRDTDKFIQLQQRPAVANKWKADAFVSIHHNSAGSKPTGHMTIHRGGAGKKLGDDIMRELKGLTSYEDIGNSKDSRGLAVLRGAKVPATLVELLSVSNAKERKTLKTPAEQRAMAEAIVKGIAENKGVKYTPPVKPEKKAEPAAEAPKAERKAEPKAKSEAVQKPEPKAEPATKRDAKPEAAPAAEPKAEQPAEAKTEAKAQPEAEAGSRVWGLGEIWRLLFG